MQSTPPTEPVEGDSLVGTLAAEVALRREQLAAESELAHANAGAPDGIAVPTKPKHIRVAAESGLASVAQARHLAREYAQRESEIVARACDEIVNNRVEGVQAQIITGLSEQAAENFRKLGIVASAAAEAFDKLAVEIERLDAIIEARTWRGRLRRFFNWLMSSAATPEPTLVPNYDVNIDRYNVQRLVNCDHGVAPDARCEHCDPGPNTLPGSIPGMDARRFAVGATVDGPSALAIDHALEGMTGTSPRSSEALRAQLDALAPNEL